jgi:hypothetical protein
MSLLAIAFPMLPGQMDRFQAFVRELAGPRNAEFATSRRRRGVHERSFHQQTPNGDIVLVTLEGRDPTAALKGFGEDDDAFARWFRGEVMAIHGVDLTAPPRTTLPELVVDSGA